MQRLRVLLLRERGRKNVSCTKCPGGIRWCLLAGCGSVCTADAVFGDCSTRMLSPDRRPRSRSRITVTALERVPSNELFPVQQSAGLSRSTPHPILAFPGHVTTERGQSNAVIGPCGGASPSTHASVGERRSSSQAVHQILPNTPLASGTQLANLTPTTDRYIRSVGNTTEGPAGHGPEVSVVRAASPHTALSARLPGWE